MTTEKYQTFLSLIKYLTFISAPDNIFSAHLYFVDDVIQ